MLAAARLARGPVACDSGSMRRRERTEDDGGGARAAVAALGRRSRTSRIPDAVRAQVVAYARRQRPAGRSWQRIARGIGVSAGSLQNWARAPAAPRTLVPVTVAAAEPAPSLVVVSPGGYRVEGLDVATASALLRALG
jgi:transposase